MTRWPALATGPKADAGGLPSSLALAGGFCVFILLIALPDFSLDRPLPLPFPPPSVFVVLLAGITALAHLHRGRLPADRIAVWVIAWVILILTLTLAGFAAAGFGLESLEPFKVRLYALISLAGAFTLGRDRQGRRALVRALALAMVVDLAFQGYEMAHPSTFSEVHGRAAGLFQNPNSAAAALGSVLLALWHDLPRKSQGPLFALMAVGILGTFSRASMSGWRRVGTLGRPLGLWQGRQGSLWLFLFLAALAGFLLFVQSGMLETLHWEALNGNTLNRVRFGLGDGSAMERAEIARLGWRKIAEAPWFGYGLASPYRFSAQATHNMYLFNWIEFGILGVLLLPMILAPLALGRANDRLFMLYFLWLGCFNHNLLDARYFLLPLGFLLAGLPRTRGLQARPATP